MPRGRLPIENKQFSGVMNYDDPNDVLPNSHHKSAMNVVFRGNQGNMRAEPIMGTRLVPNSLLPSGSNLTLAAKYDSVSNRIFIFNYNSLGAHGIYVYNTRTTVFQTLLVIGAGTDGDILGFIPTIPITSIDVFHGDPSQGDILYFLDCLGRPTKINVDRYLSNTYSNVKRSFIDVAKAPPQMPIKCVYENDSSVTENNLRNTLFQFIYRWVYDDNEKSVWSTDSIVPLPFQPSDTLTQNDFTLNSRISLFFSTGDLDVKKIEVAFRYVKDGAASDYYLISSFDKSLLSISNNDIYWYKFYNKDSYIPLDGQEQALLQSLVPQSAVSQALLNGNVLSYANITEGYDLFTPNISVNQPTGASYYFDYNGLLFFAAINGVDSGSVGTQLKVYLCGTGTNTLGNVTTLNNGNAFYKLNIINSSYTQIGTSYNSGTDTPTVSSVLSAISSALVSNGFTLISLSGNMLTMTYPTSITLLSSGTSTTGASFDSATNASTVKFAYPYTSSYAVGLMYFDSKGRTNGAILGASFTTGQNDFTQNLSPEVEIKHRPPLWATSYQVIRTANLTYASRLSWITNGAYADLNNNILGIKYAYLEIDNIVDYNLNMTASQGVVGYSFTAGDRVKILNRYTATGTKVSFTANFDYEILGTVNEVVVNGIIKSGTFLKIFAPSASDISAGLIFNGDADYLSYQILVYSYAKHSTADKEIYFEFGKCFGIGNSGTANAYHIGLSQTQSVDLATSAKISISNGDYFARKRIVPVGQSFNYTTTGFGNGFVYISPQFNVVGPSTANSVYEIKSSLTQQSNTLYPGDYSDDKTFFINHSASSLTVRIRCSIPVTVDAQTSTAILFQAVKSDGSYDLVTAVNAISMVSGVSYNIDVDQVIIVPSGGKLHLLIQNTSQVINQNVAGFSVTLDVINNISIPIIEESFSDIYKMVTNSNGRPSIYNPNARKITNGVLFRYSQPYQQGTNINQTNLFYDLNFDEFSNEFGGVMAMVSRNKHLRVFQYRKCGMVGIYNKFIKNSTGDSSLAVSDTIITPNNIQYYVGDFGVANQATSLCSDGDVDYFADPVKGACLRLADDGITAISETAKMQSFTGSKFTNYLTDKAFIMTKSKILSAFHVSPDKHGEMIMCLQESDDETNFPYTLSFSERYNAFTSFYGYYPDWILNYENVLVTFKNGNLYIHDSATYNNFYDEQKQSSITFVFNQLNMVKKTFDYISIDSNDYWTSPIIGDINTSLGHASNLIDSDFEETEGMYDASFMMDANSINGVVDGDYLKGNWIEITLRQSNPSNFVYLSGLLIGYKTSPRNYINF